jgi:Flp pilus assembly CpaF family ATPase
MEQRDGSRDDFERAELEMLAAFQRDMNALLQGRQDPHVLPSDDRAIWGISDKVVRDYHAATARTPSLPRLSRAQYLEIRQRLYFSHTHIGPLGDLLKLEGVEDIHINGLRSIELVFADHREVHPPRHKSIEELELLVRYYAEQAGQHFDASNPAVTVTLPDGSRLNALMPPICEPFSITIRKQQFLRFRDPDDLVREQALPRSAVTLLVAAVKARLNIAIAGSTGCGKTTFARVLALQIPEGERTCVMETERELFLHDLRDGFLSIEERHDNVEGAGRITLRDLFARGVLRQRPRRVIVGEVRGDEAYNLLEVMGSGHDGSLTTVHASAPRSALDRLHLLTMAANPGLPSPVVYQMIGRGVDLVIHLGQFPRDDVDARRLESLSFIDENIEDPSMGPMVQEVCTYDQSEDTWRWDADALRFMPQKVAVKFQRAGIDTFDLKSRVVGRDVG